MRNQKEINKKISTGMKRFLASLPPDDLVKLKEKQALIFKREDVKKKIAEERKKYYASLACLNVKKNTFKKTKLKVFTMSK